MKQYRYEYLCSCVVRNLPILITTKDSDEKEYFLARGSTLNCQFADQVTTTSLTVLLSKHVFTEICLIWNNKS